MDNFVKKALVAGGEIQPLLISTDIMDGPSLTNPSVLTINDIIVANIRNVNYTLYHSEYHKFEHRWGPLSYIHPENDNHLRTTNYLSILDKDLNTKFTSKVNTSLLDKDPLWDFVGLEDARLIVWDNKLFLCGVRRDTTTNGQGRMELSEIIIDNNEVKEISRFRIPSPNESEYCNKNWMPILSMPYHFIKWCNPIEIVKADPSNQTCQTIYTDNTFYPGYADWRGSSQVVSIEDFYIAAVHETYLYRTETGSKDATYRHRFLIWNKDWQLIKISPLFSFMDAKIEFCCGMDKIDNFIIITFGYQDNAAYILKFPISFLKQFIYE